REHLLEDREVQVGEAIEPDAALPDVGLPEARLRLLDDPVAGLVGETHVEAEAGLGARAADAARVAFVTAGIAVVVLAVPEHGPRDVRLEPRNGAADQRVELFEVLALRLGGGGDVLSGRHTPTFSRSAVA